MQATSAPRLGDVVRTKFAFKGFIQLDQALRDKKYRDDCRQAFICTETENEVFRLVVKAARGHLDQGRRNLLLVSPYGTGKTLDLVMTHDIFSTPANRAAVRGFDPTVRTDLLALTSEKPYLVVPVVGKDSARPLSQAILEAFCDAVENHYFLSKARATGGRFLVPVEFEQAARRLDEIDGGSRSYLRDAFTTALGIHQTRETRHTLTSLRASLQQFDPGALDAWRWAVEQATGERPARFSATPKEVFDSALPILCQHGFAGIALLIDELSQYLLLFPEYQTEAVRTLDPIVHWIQSTETCFSVVATQLFPERLPDSAEDSYQAWGSLRGRFHPYYMARRRYDKLVAGALERVEPAPTNPDIHPQMSDLRELHVTCFGGLGEDRDAVQRSVAAYYPFSPTVISAIGPIADTLGQFARSIFQYLAQTVEGGFKDLIGSRLVYGGGAGQRLELVTLDDVFAFFARDWPKLEGANPRIAEAWRSGEAAVREHPLELRALNLLALLAFLEGRAVLPTPDVRGIGQMLNVPGDSALEAALKYLTDAEIVVYDERDGYRLGIGGGPRASDVQREMQRRITEDQASVTGSDARKYLTEYDMQVRGLAGRREVPVFPIKTSYERLHKQVKRKFTREFLSARDLVQRSDGLRQDDSLEGQLFVGVLTDADDPDGALHAKAARAASRLAQRGAIVALPTQATNAFAGPIRHLRAALATAEDAKFASPAAQEERDKARFELLSTFSNHFAASRLLWYLPSDASASVKLDDIEDAIKLTLGALAREFPDNIGAPDVVGRTKANDLIGLLLGGGSTVELAGKWGQVLTDALAPLGVVTITTATLHDPKRTVTVQDPGAAQSGAGLWAILSECLQAGEIVDSKKLTSALERLGRPPCWCPDDLIHYLLAAFLGKHKGQVRPLGNTSFRIPAVEDLRRLVAQPGQHVVRIPQRVILSDDQGLFVRALGEALAATLPQGALHFSTSAYDLVAPEAMLASLRTDLEEWYRRSGAYAFDLIRTHELNSGDSPLAFLNAIAQAFSGGSDQALEARFYTCTLPESLGVPIGQAPLTVEQMVASLTRLAKADVVVARAARLFGNDGQVEVAWTAFKAACLDPDLQAALSRAVEDCEARLRADASPRPGAPPNGPGAARTTREGDAGTNRTTVMTAADVRLFATFLAGVIDEIENGQRTVTSLGELVEAFYEAHLAESDLA